LDKSLWEGAGVTPFVGLGGGVAGGYADATRSSDSKFNTKIGYGPAVRVNAGMLFNISDSFGVTLGYDGVGTGGGREVYYIHTGELGLRYTF
jgi:hypothetical protein